MLDRGDVERHFAARGRTAGLLLLGAGRRSLDHVLFDISHAPLMSVSADDDWWAPHCHTAL